MRRTMCILLAGIMLLSITGCKTAGDTEMSSSVVYENIYTYIDETLNENTATDSMPSEVPKPDISSNNTSENSSVSSERTPSNDASSATSSGHTDIYIPSYEPEPSGNYVITNNSTTDKYADTIIVNGKKYNYVWGDEFDSDSIDYGPQYYDNRPIEFGKTWDTTGMLPWFDDISIPSDVNDRKKYNYVKDGELVMKAGCYDWSNSVKSYNGKDARKLDYAIGGVLTSRQTMVYRRGYAEICAKLPMDNGGWPAWWLRSTGSELIKYPDGTDQYDPIFTLEVDVFEAWTYLKDEIYPTVHKFYKNTYDSESKTVYDYNGNDITDKIIGNRSDEGSQFSVRCSRNAFDLKNTDDYHTYGFLWTDTEMVFMIDGVDYFTLDLTTPFDGYSDGRYDYNQYMYFLFDCYMITPGATWGGAAEQRYTGTGDTSNLEMNVKYIRLWQEDGKVDIITNQ